MQIGALGDIHGAFGTIRVSDVSPRRTWRRRVLTLLAILGPGIIGMGLMTFATISLAAGMLAYFVSALAALKLLAGDRAATLAALVAALFVLWMIYGLGLPLWLACLGVIVAYNVTVAPIRMARRAAYHSLAGPAQASLAAFDALISVAVGAALVWTAYQHLPEVQQWMTRLPEAWHNVAASFAAR